MNPRALTADVLLGAVPIALSIGLWQALVSFGYAPATLLPPPGRVFARLVQQLLAKGGVVSGARRGHANPLLLTRRVIARNFCSRARKSVAGVLTRKLDETGASKSPAAGTR